ncbi:uncharacterized protein LOC125206975 [Salvia hispanica]|uniref:uncharacterized protein LOC125206975 n=1 Tax=Salvia hispanica TaxID=49212 RepID=UPI002009DB89|nr:uncharacterized protein LOC125206975 [Salvia hispanica]
MEEEWEKREMVDHWSHEHPLTLVETRGRDECYGCRRLFTSGEQAYGCSITECEYSKLLHEGCAATVREIRHPLHHQHILRQRHKKKPLLCSICDEYIWSIGYECTSSGCSFEVHLWCGQDKGVVDASHASHELKLLRRICLFKCDACGITSRGRSYTCTTGDCQYWIHERCASLPQTIKREDHHHSLSLSSYIPPEYIKTLIPPIIILAAAAAIDELMKVEYEFLHHQHKLTLLSSGDPTQEEEEEEEEDEENYGVRSELICDGCITPISSNSSSKHYYYMGCSECKYNLHIACFHLPSQLSSLSVHDQHDDHHSLDL